ncbi:selenophosphate synthase [Geobacter sp. DSM 9736]|nr:selenophosphate synthase [Geobacter sp. DSM 9736]
MRGLLGQTDPALLVGPETSDDAGVYRISANLALVETADIITPVVDDPFLFGRIAAANALSDVYAMGGRPVTATNLAFFPACRLGADVLADLLAGGLATLREAGVCLVGGHTVEDDELKYGLAVTGLVDPERIVRNSTARPGDLLVLTKPVGTGIISTAIKADMAPAFAVERAVAEMAALNAAAAELMLECSVSAATDVTGFGLIGHACEMARGAGVGVRLVANDIPLIPGVPELVDSGLVPAGCYRNRDYYLASTRTLVDPDRLLPFFDPQTSGGLLIALPPKGAELFLACAPERGCSAALVGEVVKAGAGCVEIL